ncbi:MAG: anti-sigma factor, partial [Solirubrobacteraceae bacterium]
ACLAVGFGAGALVESGHSGGSTPAPRQANVPSVVLRPLAPGSGHSLAVAYMPGSDQMLLRVAHLPPSAPGTYYELWLMSSLRRLTPVTAFQIGEAGQARLTLRLPDSSSRYLYLDISLQRVGGGTGHSGDSVLRGRLT